MDVELATGIVQLYQNMSTRVLLSSTEVLAVAGGIGFYSSEVILMAFLGIAFVPQKHWLLIVVPTLGNANCFVTALGQ